MPRIEMDHGVGAYQRYVVVAELRIPVTGRGEPEQAAVAALEPVRKALRDVSHEIIQLRVEKT